MSEFKCEIVKIDDVINHPNADRLSIVKIRGYECISAKLEDGTHRYNAGDWIVYIPEASIIPDWILQKMGFWDNDNNCGTLSGSRKNRVKAIKLRQIVSQGILYPVYKESDSTGKLTTESGNTQYVSLGDDVSQHLGITKYEPQVPAQMQGVLGALFGITKKYDIESLQNNPNVFNENDEVVVTEKLHGTLGQFIFVRKEKLTNYQKLLGHAIYENWYAFATSKGLGAKGFIQKITEENMNNVYVKTLFDVFINTKIANLIVDAIDMGDAYSKTTTDQVTIFGEIFGAGIQDLTYGQSKHTFKIFDGMLDDSYFDYKNLDFFASVGLELVPLLYQGKFDLQKITELRDGKTTLGADHIREGVVIKMAEEAEYHRLPSNRKQLKFVSPDYLLRKDGTEFQ